MRKANKVDMDVFEQIEAAMSEVCGKVCKHYANADMELYRIENGISDKNFKAKIDDVEQRLHIHCEECPLKIINHAFAAKGEV